jgi:hypothetical protein
MMDNNLPAVQPDLNDMSDLPAQASETSEEITKLQKNFQARLVTANLRTEAVQAGMIDLDGLKLVDLSAVQLDNDDKVVDGRKLMEDLRRNKPWLFTAASSSSAAIAPTSQPIKSKTAMDMTDEEYSAARIAVTKYQL